MTSSLSSINLLENFTEVRKTLTCVYQFIDEYGKEYRWQSNEEGCRARSGRVLSAGASALWSWGMSLCQCGFVCQPGSSLNPTGLELYGGFRTWTWLSPFPALFPSLEDEEWGWRLQTSNQGLVSLAMSPHPTSIQEPSESHSCRATEGKKKKMFLVFLSLKNLQGF